MPTLVAEHPLFVGLPEPVVAEVVGCARNVVFDTGSLLLAEGDPADTLYLVRRGTVAIEVHTPGKGALVVETVGPGGVVGWSWLIPPYRSQFDARAREPVGAVAIDGGCLRSKADIDPVLGYALLRRVSEVLLDRLQATRFRLLDLYGDGAAAGGD
jgi:CRP-like cAMP-binding protein